MGGYQQLVRGDVMRGKFRNSFEKPEPFVPGKPTPGAFTLPDVVPHLPAGPPASWSRSRAPGSRWSTATRRRSWISTGASEADFQKATQRVYHSAEMPTHLEMLELLK